MSEALKQKEPTFNNEIRNFDDTTTWLAEVLDGSMRSQFSYQYDGEDLRARDGSRMGPVFMDAVKAAEDRAHWQPGYGFELRRRRKELDEYREMLAMASGDGPNTMVVVSDFPAEVLDSGKDTLGYNALRRQTMLRIISRDDRGELTMVSQSLDRSDRRSLEKIYDFLGAPVQRGELLGQRIKLHIDQPFQSELADTLMRVYDDSLSSLYGGEWYAGRRDQDRRNTLDFALQQDDLLAVYLNGPRDEQARYNLSAAVTARFEKDQHLTPNVRTRLTVDEGYYFAAAFELEQQGRLARSQNKSFSGCGATLSANSEASEQLEANGYGDNDKKLTTKDMKCVSCPQCRTFHETVRKVAGKPVCDNPDCKLSDKKK